MRHSRKHSGAYPYTCVECRKGFNSKVKLDDHNRVLHGARRFVCPCCNKTICSSYGRKHHGDLHSTEVFPCPQCDKKFTTHQYLKRHLITHTVTHVCDICAKTYSTKAHLKDHMRTHDSVVFKCDKEDCSFQTNYKTSLKRHLATHETCPNLVCVKCGHGYNRKDLLKKHENKCKGIKTLVWEMEVQC